jgi:hypothetical protein
VGIRKIEREMHLLRHDQLHQLNGNRSRDLPAPIGRLRAMDRVRVQELHRHTPVPRRYEACKTEFAADSPLEEAGFEPSVPH